MCHPKFFLTIKTHPFIDKFVLIGHTVVVVVVIDFDTFPRLFFSLFCRAFHRHLYTHQLASSPAILRIDFTGGTEVEDDPGVIFIHAEDFNNRMLIQLFNKIAAVDNGMNEAVAELVGEGAADAALPDKETGGANDDGTKETSAEGEVPVVNLDEELPSLTSHDISTVLSVQDRSVEFIGEFTGVEALAKKVNFLVQSQESMAKDLAVVKAALLDMTASTPVHAKMPSAAAAAAVYCPPEQQFMFPSVQQQLSPEAGSSIVPPWTVVGQGDPYRPSTTNPLVLAIKAACSGRSSDFSGKGKKIIVFGEPKSEFSYFLDGWGWRCKPETKFFSSKNHFFVLAKNNFFIVLKEICWM